MKKSTTTEQLDVINDVGGRRQLQYLKLYEAKWFYLDYDEPKFYVCFRDIEINQQSNRKAHVRDPQKRYMAIHSGVITVEVWATGAKRTWRGPTSQRRGHNTQKKVSKKIVSLDVVDV